MRKLFKFGSRFHILKDKVPNKLIFAIPTDGTVVKGTATINRKGSIIDIPISTNKTIINWDSFNIKSGETINFNQPNSNSIIINRVVGGAKSIIDGSINTNGQIWILNSNGIIFDKNAKVNTTSILATTKELSNEDFQSGNYNFKKGSKATIKNFGNIYSQKYIAFISNNIINSGTIKVKSGIINLIGASKFYVNLDDNLNLSLMVV